MKLFCLVLAIVGVVLVWNYFHRPITYPPGVLIGDDPAQVMLPGDTPGIAQGQFELKPLALFSIDARVLHRKVYRYDKGAALVPVDLALGWGPMSDQRVLDQIKITQSMRFYWFEYRQAPISKDEIISHSTNVHIIPSTKAIASQCESLRVGTLVHLSGDLVEASGPQISTWRSSLSRTDTGNGACELMWVKELSILSAPITNDRTTIVTR